MGVRELATGFADLMADLWRGDTYGTTATYRATQTADRIGSYAVALALYDGVHEPFLHQDIDRHYSNAFTRTQRKNAAFYFNILRKIIDGRARLYKNYPTFKGGAPVLLEALADDSMWGELIQADRISELCDLCPVVILPKSEGGGLCFEAVPPDQARIEWDPSRRGEILKFATVTQVEDAKGRGSVTYRDIWTRDEHRIFRDREDVTAEVAEEQGLAGDGTNPFGIVPVVVMRPRVCSGRNPWGQMRSDLVRAQRQINVRLTDLLYLMKLYYSQVVIESGNKAHQNFNVGADVPLILKQELEGKNPTARYLTPDVQIGQVWDAIKQIVQYLAFNEGLAAMWDQGGTASASGESRKVANADLEEIREGKRPAHLRFWADVERVGMTLLDAGSPDPKARLKVEFGDVYVYRDEEAERAKWLEEIKNGIATRAQWYMSGHPGVDEDEAAQKVAENLAAEKEYTSSTAAPKAPPSDAFLGAKARGDSPHDGEEDIGGEMNA